MSLLRHPPVAATSRTAAQERIADLDSEIRSLRGPNQPPLVVKKPMAVPVERSARALLLFGEMAREQVLIGAIDDARRSVGEGVLILDELIEKQQSSSAVAAVIDETIIAQSCVLIAEAMIAIDSPKHARPRFERAVEVFDRSGDPRWRVRARLGLGRTLVALDDIAGLTILEESRQICQMLGEKGAIEQIDHELREAEKIFDTPRHIHTGYGRPVSVMPAK